MEKVILKYRVTLISCLNIIMKVYLASCPVWCIPLPLMYTWWKTLASNLHDFSSLTNILHSATASHAPVSRWHCLANKQDSCTWINFWVQGIKNVDPPFTTRKKSLTPLMVGEKMSDSPPGNAQCCDQVFAAWPLIPVESS